MESLINAWGGEGVLSSTAVFIMGALGMFSGVVNAGEKVHVRILDLEYKTEDRVTTDYGRALSFAKMYTDYYEIMYDKKPELVCDDITIYDVVDCRNSTSVYTKYANNPLLSLGCTQEDISLDIENGIYGKPWLGEIFYSGENDTFFRKLYDGIPNGDVITINCGGYRGGGTATTFIPMENSYIPPDHRVHRYMVISGPSTKFEFNLTIPHPEIYINFPELKKGFDIFDIPTVKNKLLSFNPSLEQFVLHQENLDALDEYWNIVVNDQYKLSNLDPNFYASRFLDRLYSDISKVNATFINIKTDGKKLLEYDVTSNEYQPKEQKHWLHISNLINGLSIREILVNNGDYKDGAVYAFGNSSGNIFASHTLFNESCMKHYWTFIVMAALMTYYVHDALLLNEVPENAPANSGGLFKGIFGKKTKGMSDEAKANLYLKALDNINIFLKTIVRNTLIALKEIDDKSDMTNLFPGDTRGIVDDITYKILRFNTRHSGAGSLSEYAFSILVKMIKSIDGFDRYMMLGRLNEHLQEYMKKFPDVEQFSSDDGTIFCNKIIRHTMMLAETIVK